MIVLDTSIVVDHLRNRDAAVHLLEQLLNDGEHVAASEIVRFEVLSGVRANEREAVEQFFSLVDWLALDEPTIRLAADLAREFRREHSGIDTADYLIAATALHTHARLLTTNVLHFPMFPNLAAPY